MNHLNNIAYNQFPDFLQKKIASFYVNRVGEEWNGKHVLRGLIPDKNALILTSNDYLFLANHDEVILAQVEALRANINVPLMSATFLHGENPQSVTEKRFAGFFDSEEAILCQSGYAANLGLLQTLTESTETPVYVDMMAHMSLWDGARLGNGHVIPFLHNSVEHLENKIRQFGPGILMLDAVYSTNGSICPLVEMVNLAHAAGCIIIVDESHSIGTHGPQGKGLVCELGLTDKVMFRTASLAKAFAGRAGLILCPRYFSDPFGVSSKPHIFSSALTLVDIAGLNMALDLISSAAVGDIRRTKLRWNSLLLKEQLLSLGFDVEESRSQIIALKTNSEWETIKLRDAMESHGVFGSPFCRPATARKRPLLRLSLHSELTMQDLDRIYIACKQISSSGILSNLKTVS